MQFTKMQGIGNDFVMVDATKLSDEEIFALKSRSQEICDRHFGVGADGVIIAAQSLQADFQMRIFNADGSEAEMCGNGIRCFAKFIYDKNLSKKLELTIDTGAGILVTTSLLEGDTIGKVVVDMGEAHLDRADVPVDFKDGATGPVIDELHILGGREFAVTCVSMGNPHCVIFVEDVESFDVAGFGLKIETDPAFPRKTNVEFAQLLPDGNIKMHVWERGAAETLACGTGACATLAAASLTGRTGRKATVHLKGGDLEIDWRENNHLFMTGPATTVFDGEF
jgi:diaminopimelate epimerase